MENIGVYLLFIIFYGIICFVIANKFGDDKAIGFGAAIAICIVTSPLIGFIILSSWKTKEKEQLERKSLSNNNSNSSLTQLQKIEYLERLKTLRDQGILTEDEFLIQKSIILTA